MEVLRYSAKDVHQLNEDIRDSEIRLIGSTGEQLGHHVCPPRRSGSPTSRGLDLVKISPQATPPVCKLMDYGKFRFEQGKREKEARKNQHVVEIKEIRMSPGIDVGDFNTKLEQRPEVPCRRQPRQGLASASAAARWRIPTSAKTCWCASPSSAPRWRHWIKSPSWKDAVCPYSSPPRPGSNGFHTDTKRRNYHAQAEDPQRFQEEIQPDQDRQGQDAPRPSRATS